MFVTIDRVTKFNYVALFDMVTKRNGAALLSQVSDLRGLDSKSRPIHS